MKGEAGFGGCLYWEQGSGLAAWDSDQPTPTEDDTALTTPLYRKAIDPSDIIYVDANGNASASRTNRIKISVSFGTGESTGKIREYGIFGGDATTTLGSGLMIDHKIHGVQTKDDDITYNRSIILSF